jgi:DNA-binding protein YbaB
MMMGMDSEILAKLKLTKPQMDAVKKVKEDTKKKMDALRGSMPKPKDGERPKMDPGMRDKFKGLMDGYQAGMKKAMGDKKFAEYQKMMKEAMDKMREKGGFGGGRPGGPGAAGGAGKGKGGNKPGL